MSTKQASPLVGVIILIGFIVIGMTVLFTVREKLQTHKLHAENASWAKAQAVSRVAAEPVSQPRTVLASFEPNPRPGAKVRTLREFYSRRGFAGGPPVIAHDIESDGVNDNCLSCHKDGGFVPEYNAYTPITPHPEMENCLQCHVPQVVEGEFTKTMWTQPELPKRGRQAIPGGPLLIPHGLQMRENCLACHAGPHAVVEIKTSHPEREGCLQCHVLDQDYPPFKSLLNNQAGLADAEK